MEPGKFDNPLIVGEVPEAATVPDHGPTQRSLVSLKLPDDLLDQWNGGFVIY